MTMGHPFEKISPETEDELVTLIMQRVAASGHYQGVRECMTPAGRALVDEAIERYATRARESGQPGW